MPYPPTVHTDLSEALRRRTLALFLGADLPRTVTGVPSRADVVRALAKRYGFSPHLPLADCIEQAIAVDGRSTVLHRLRSLLYTSNVSLHLYHIRLASFIQKHYVEMVITTAYDTMLERALQQSNTVFVRVVRGRDVPFIRPSRPSVIKLYGEAHQPETLVVTRDDRQALFNDDTKTTFLTEVRRTLQRSTTLFIGYNLNQAEDFPFLFNDIAQMTFERTAYMICPSMAGSDLQPWREKNISVLNTDPFGILDGLV